MGTSSNTFHINSLKFWGWWDVLVSMLISSHLLWRGYKQSGILFVKSNLLPEMEVTFFFKTTTNRTVISSDWCFTFAALVLFSLPVHFLYASSGDWSLWLHHHFNLQKGTSSYSRKGQIHQRLLKMIKEY